MAWRASAAGPGALRTGRAEDGKGETDMDWLLTFAANLKAQIAGAQFVFSPLYIASTLVIAYGLWSFRGRRGSFLRFVFPREIYSHPSTGVDIKVALFNICFAATGVPAGSAARTVSASK